MKKIIIGLLGKYLGINKALAWVDGNGTFIAGGGLALAGLAQILIDVVPVIATRDPAALVAFATAIAAHPGAHKLLEGLAIIRIRMAIAKSAPVEADKPL